MVREGAFFGSKNLNCTVGITTPCLGQTKVMSTFVKNWLHQGHGGTVRPVKIRWGVFEDYPGLSWEI